MGYVGYHETLDQMQEEEEAMTTHKSAAQPWLNNISVMMQSVLFSAIRGPDGFRKHHPAKPLLKWYRRCVLISAFDGVALDNPHTPGGGSFTGPAVKLHDFEQTVPFFTSDISVDYSDYNFGGIPSFGFDTWYSAMHNHVNAFIHSRDEMTLHYYAHAMHAFGILGYEHPVDVIRGFWFVVYARMCNALHLPPETMLEMRRRLSDDQEQWSMLSDEAGSCSE